MRITMVKSCSFRSLFGFENKFLKKTLNLAGFGKFTEKCKNL